MAYNPCSGFLRVQERAVRHFTFYFAIPGLIAKRQKITQKNNLVNFGYNYLKDIYLKGIIQLNNSSNLQVGNQILLKSELINDKINPQKLTNTKKNCKKDIEIILLSII